MLGEIPKPGRIELDGISIYYVKGDILICRSDCQE
jgi:hypothetical protein